MTLKDGLAAMRNSRKEGKGPEEQVQEESGGETPALDVAPTQKTAEKREPFATRLKPSLRYGLKRRVLELSEQGERVTVEDLLNALLDQYLEDEALQQTVEERLG